MGNWFGKKNRGLLMGIWNAHTYQLVIYWELVYLLYGQINVIHG